MKQYIALISALALSVCGGGSGGGTEINLTPAEHLFGAGIVTGQTPTHLVPREEGAGFEILSFGAWGNIYDIKKTTNFTGAWRSGLQSIYPGKYVFDFSDQIKLDITTNFKFSRDASVANATFVGPAIVYISDIKDNLYITDSDYGTMKVKFGQDIANTRLEFVMNNPDNNLVTTSTYSWYPNFYFTEDRQNIAICHDTRDGTIEKIYFSYGSKQ